jgi:hypothetical protein
VMAEMYRKNFTTLSNGKAELSATDLRTGGDQAEARLSGHDAAGNVRFAVAVRANPVHAVSFSLYRYTLAELGVPFETQAGVIFDLIQLR